MTLSGHIVILRRNGTSGYVCDWFADKCVFGSNSLCDVYMKLNDVDPFHCKLEKVADGRVFFVNIANSPRTLLNGATVSGRTFVPHSSVLTVVDRDFQFLYPVNSSWRNHPASSEEGKSVQAPTLLSSTRLVAEVPKLPAVISSSPKRSHLQTARSRTPTISSQRRALSTKERYGPTPSRPVASSPFVSVKSCVTNRNSLSTKRSSLNALASSARKKVKVNVFCETPTLSGTQCIARLRKSNSNENSLHSNNSASFYSKMTLADLSSTSFIAPSTGDVTKKGVQFGPRLSPEQFDSSLPPSTPIKRGDLPSSGVKSKLGYMPSPVLIHQSPNLKDAREPLRTPKLRNSSDFSGAREQAKTQPSPKLTETRAILKTPKSLSSPKLSNLRELLKTPEIQPPPKLFGVRKILRTRKSPLSPRLSGVRKLVKTPKSVPSPRLFGVRRLVKTSKVNPLPAATGSRGMLRTPIPASPSRLSGVRGLLETPKIQTSPKLASVHEMLRPPKSPPSPRLSGVRKLVKTPKSLPSPRLSGIRKLVRTPKADLSPRLTGIREMLKTPKPPLSPRLSGIRKLVKTPKSLRSPRLSGVRMLVKTPKSLSSPRLAGIREMLRTPKSVPSPRLSAVREMMEFSSVMENATPLPLASKRKALKRGLKLTRSKANLGRSTTAKLVEDSVEGVSSVRKISRRNASNPVVAASLPSAQNAGISTSSATTHLGLRNRGKRKRSLSRETRNVEDTPNAKPALPKTLRRTRGQRAIVVDSMASKGVKKAKSSKSQAVLTGSRRAGKIGALSPVKESEIVDLVEISSKKRATRAAAAVSNTAFAPATRRTRRVTSAVSEKSSPAARIKRSTRRVRFDVSVPETKPGEGVSRTPLPRAGVKGVKSSAPKLLAKKSTASSLRTAVSEPEKQKSKTVRPVRRNRSKM